MPEFSTNDLILVLEALEKSILLERRLEFIKKFFNVELRKGHGIFSYKPISFAEKLMRFDSNWWSGVILHHIERKTLYDINANWKNQLETVRKALVIARAAKRNGNGVVYMPDEYTKYFLTFYYNELHNVRERNGN